MAQVHSTTNAVEADALLALLREHGIHGIIENENAGLVLGMPTSAVPLIITVSQVHEKHARSLLRDALQGRFRGMELPSELMVTIQCVCGKELEIPGELEIAGFECPFCGVRVGGSGQRE